MDTISINDLKNFEIDIDFFSLIIKESVLVYLLVLLLNLSVLFISF